jgi:hypothetical protein
MSLLAAAVTTCLVLELAFDNRNAEDLEVTVADASVP